MGRRKPGRDRGQPPQFRAERKRQAKLQAGVVGRFAKTEKLAFELAAATHENADRFVESLKITDLACKKGCSYCCHQPATVFAFEAIEIAHHLRGTLPAEKLEALKAKMRARVKGLTGASVRASINDKTACPLLEGDACSVYALRPTTCRVAHSFSVKRCRASFEKDRFKESIPISIEYLSGVSGILEGVYDDLPKAGVDAKLYELCSAVLAALADPGAAKKWAGGNRSVFKDCVEDDT